MATRLSVPQPCPTDWAQMTPVAGGRYCTSCEKVVVDFTRMNEAEVLAWLGRHGRTCGHFRPNQLAHNQRPRNWAVWLAAAAVTLGACETPAPEQLQLRTPPAATPADVLVHGQVVDLNSGRPLAGAYITSLADSSVQTRSDAAGRFALRLPPALRDSMLYVTASADATHDYHIGRRVPLAAELTVRLRGLEAVLGESHLALEPGETFVPHRPKSLPPPPRVSTIKFTPPEAE
ncbi:carboxypeptidase-like regulatory domain-containing protein [Hymenobacter jeollabukensis]|uniref:Carboxypeptidase-like regulatory domain-containing protein n=1 Tax=Hymenobacter jeollabukensis TaxID=2025313 RepID=A0A5R8WTW0_9BACT|nr:carboxypeptidase-like regulatory domain-containing protein [Hymenobacter jeollabukensis]TLM95211.1 carboxypeptidase-like regulatory domain-containing protein [Hymenobacter jeollabukensis]